MHNPDDNTTNAAQEKQTPLVFSDSRQRFHSPDRSKITDRLDLFWVSFHTHNEPSTATTTYRPTTMVAANAE